MRTIKQFLVRILNAGTFSPTAFVVRALLVSVLYGVSLLLGFKEYTAFLSGTSPGGDISWQTASTLGLIHLLLHVGFILFVPISLITAALLAAKNHWRFKNGRSNIH
ncbi:MAG TPA: hypothetical protein VH255_01365 [Verrucomicrobiae bacterium]|nr:hypothetical protein [Verrucomicrobiae bacterium]